MRPPGTMRSASAGLPRVAFVAASLLAALGAHAAEHSAGVEGKVATFLAWFIICVVPIIGNSG
ncbi:hypothetical protein WKW80_36270 [Variovorax humicola]|uniref:Uncharacterized protein n=1 Tax=Variovorax humicola TaxID=1769758 RepID=A0ABU8WDE4_9BURK